MRATSLTPSSMAMQLKRVYLVDDNHNNIALTRRALANAGLPVAFEVVQSMPALISLLSEAQCNADLILIDSSQSSRVDDKQVQQLCQYNKLHHTPVVMVSSDKSNDSVLRSYELGASSYIYKAQDFTEYALQLKRVCNYWLDLNVLPVTPVLSQSA